MAATRPVIEPDDHVWLVAAASRNKTAAARLLLDAGWPPAAGAGVTALHWAGYQGNAELVRDLLARGAPRDARDPEYQGTPHDWAQHGERNGACRAGDYAAVLEWLR
jgi:ankyrin repeat protein